MTWKTFPVVLTLTLVGLVAGSLNAYAQCGPSQDRSGRNADCYLTGGCQDYHWCMWMACEVDGTFGCLPGHVNECIFAGCYNPLWGNCSGRC